MHRIASSAAIVGVVLAGCSNDPPMMPADARVRDAAIDADIDAPPDAPDAFDMELPGFRSALCDAIFTCSDPDTTQAECEDDVTDDMLGFKALLDDKRELQCASCMRVTAEQARAYVTSGCDEAVLMDQTAVIAACDLTPDNGMVDTEEACGGSP